MNFIFLIFPFMFSITSFDMRVLPFKGRDKWQKSSTVAITFKSQNTEVSSYKYKTQNILKQNTMSHIGFRTFD